MYFVQEYPQTRRGRVCVPDGRLAQDLMEVGQPWETRLWEFWQLIYGVGGAGRSVSRTTRSEPPALQVDLSDMHENGSNRVVRRRTVYSILRRQITLGPLEGILGMDLLVCCKAPQTALSFIEPLARRA
jgi:hypothetical protein